VLEPDVQEPQASAQAGTGPMFTENEPEYLSGEEDYVDSDFEGKDGYRRGVHFICYREHDSRQADGCKSM
jgi:hypothetical protein